MSKQQGTKRRIEGWKYQVIPHPSGKFRVIAWDGKNKRHINDGKRKYFENEILAQAFVARYA